MANSVTIHTLDGEVTYNPTDVMAPYESWCDDLGAKFLDKTVTPVNNFNSAHMTFWNSIKDFPKIEKKDFMYESMMDRIEKLEA